MLENKVKEKEKKLEQEHRRNIIQRYAQKVQYYKDMGYSESDAMTKARRFYKIIQ